MRKYIYNARDIAAYFKYFSVPQYLEVSYMQYIFNFGKPIIAVPLTKDFEKFKREVYRELYSLWANGFEGETSDISAMCEEGQISLICDQECINLESYMKLIALHLIITRNLPYVNLNFTGLPLSLGIRCDFSVFEKNVADIVEALQLETFDKFGNRFDLKLGVPDELLRVSLCKEYVELITKSKDFRESLRVEQIAKMKELKDKSKKLLGLNHSKKSTKKSTVPKATKKPAKAKAKAYEANIEPKVDSKSQPKGAPLKGNR